MHSLPVFIVAYLEHGRTYARKRRAAGVKAQKCALWLLTHPTAAPLSGARGLPPKGHRLPRAVLSSTHVSPLLAWQRHGGSLPAGRRWPVGAQRSTLRSIPTSPVPKRGREQCRVLRAGWPTKLTDVPVECLSVISRCCFRRISHFLLGYICLCLFVPTAEEAMRSPPQLEQAWTACVLEEGAVRSLFGAYSARGSSRSQKTPSRTSWRIGVYTGQCTRHEQRGVMTTAEKQQTKHLR